MHRVTGIILVATMVAATLAGCALRDPRDDYGYSRGDGLWDTDYGLIDWNFPTARNQGPIEVPKRLHLDRTAIGTTWATYNPWPRSGPATAQGKSQSPAAQDDDGATAAAKDPKDMPAAAAGGGDERH